MNRAVHFCAQQLQRHPYSWKLAWEAVHRIPFLLPHDKSYHALRHFVVLRPEGLFLDIGANDGISALSFRRFSKSYRILSLEPNVLLEPALKRLKRADPHFDYKIVAAGSASERMRFFVPVYKNIVLHTFTSGNRDQVLEAITKSFGRSVASAVDIRSFDSEIIPVDSLNIEPAIIKIDAEGFDYAVLKGLTATIKRSRPFIMSEVGAAEYGQINTFLEELRYKLLTYDIFADTFGVARTDLSDAARTEPPHRNLFAAPDEILESVPIK
jgi:FkbM family methyltransferase